MNLQKVGNIARKLLTTALVFSCMGTTCLAAEQTTITYVGQGIEEYEVTVPASLTPGSSADINLSGTWAADKAVIVSAPETVTLTCDIDGSEQVLNINFDDIYQPGSNSSALDSTKNLGVSEMPSNILFGTWTGTITYEVETAFLSGGLYDEDGNCLANWYESGIDISHDYCGGAENGDKYGTTETSGTYVFRNTYANAKKAEIPNGITSIGNWAFAYAENLEEIVIPNSVTSIGVSAFESSGLRTVSIPDSVTSIGGYAFGGDSDNLTSITWRGNTYTDKAEFNTAVRDAGILTDYYDAWM